MDVRVFRSREFKTWYKELTSQEQRIVDSRIDIFKNESLLINAKNLDRNLSLYEFKWKSGMRVYFSLLKDAQDNFMLLLLGGNKNSQRRDIVKAKEMISKTVSTIKKKGK